MPFVTRRNRCTNPSFETALADWTTGGAGATFDIFARESGWADSGSWSLHFKATATAGNAIPRAIFDNNGVSLKIAAVPGTPFTVRMRVNVLSVPASGGQTVTVRFRNGSAGTITGDFVSSRVVATGVQTLTVSGTVPALSDRAEIQVGHASSITGMSIGEISEFYLDAVSYEDASSIPNYFDGSTSPDAVWEGAAHASVSKQQMIAGAIRTIVPRSMAPHRAAMR